MVVLSSRLQPGIAADMGVIVRGADLGRILLREPFKPGGGGVSHWAFARGIQTEQERPGFRGEPSAMRTRLKHPPSGKSRLSQ